MEFFRDDAESDEQPHKRGIWFTDKLQAASWRLAPGQSIIAHCHPAADELLLVVSGQGEYLAYDSPPDAAVCYVPRADAVVVPPPAALDGTLPRRLPVGPGAAAMTEAGRYHGLINIGTEPLLAVVVTGPDPSGSIYTVRR
ncbi:cupin domain-containing protein [Actinocorallia aurea]